MCDGIHRGGGEDFRLHAQAADGAGDGERVHDRGEHAHAVARDAVETLAHALQAAEEVAAAVDDRHLVAGLDGFNDFAGVAHEVILIDSFACGAAQGLTAQLQQNSHRFSVCGEQIYWKIMKLARLGLYLQSRLALIQTRCLYSTPLSARNSSRR